MNSRLRNLLNGRRAPTVNNIELLVNELGSAINKNTSNQLEEILNKIPLPVKRNLNLVNFTAPALFHGRPSLLKNGYPAKPGGSWFAKTPQQAILHAVSGSLGEPSYLYVYHFKKTPKLINIKSSRDFNNVGTWLARYTPVGGWAFSNANYSIAKKLCKLTPKIADGWYFPKDQNQVMLCEPRKFLKLYKVYKIQGSNTRSPNFRVNRVANEAYWIRPKGLRYGLQPVRIIRKPSVSVRKNNL